MLINCGYNDLKIGELMPDTDYEVRDYFSSLVVTEDAYGEVIDTTVRHMLLIRLGDGSHAIIYGYLPSAHYGRNGLSRLWVRDVFTPSTARGARMIFNNLKRGAELANERSVQYGTA